MSDKADGLSPEIIAAITAKNLRNIAAKVAAGKTLSLQERKQLEASQTTPPATRMEHAEKREIGVDTLASIIGIKPRRIQILASQGVLTRIGKGHYEFPACVQQYCDYLRGGAESDRNALECKRLQVQTKIMEEKLNEIRESAYDEAVDNLREERAAFAAPLTKALEKARKHMDKAGWDAINTALKSMLPKGAKQRR